MMKIAFLGGGKIGRAMIEHVREKKNGEIEFVYDPFIKKQKSAALKWWMRYRRISSRGSIWWLNVLKQRFLPSISKIFCRAAVSCRFP